MYVVFPQRATAGLRRATPELADANHENGNSGNSNSVNGSPTQPASPVTMEMSSSAPLTNLERESLFSGHSQEEEELDYPGVHGEGEEVAGENRNDGDECDRLIFEMGNEKGGSDSEGGEDEGREELEGEEGEVKMEDEDRAKAEGEDGKKTETESDGWDRREAEAAKTEGEEGESSGRTDVEENTWKGGEEGEVKEDVLSDLLFTSDTLLCPSPPEPLEATSQETWGPDLGTRDDLSDSHLSDCLQAELAIVYSDSDAGEDQWSAFTPSDITSHIEGAGGSKEEGRDEKEEEEDREQEEDEVKAETKTQEQKIEMEVEESKRGSRADDEEQMRMRRDLFLRSPSVSSTASSTDPEKKVF